MIQQLGGNIQNKDKSIIRKQEFYKKYNDIDLNNNAISYQAMAKIIETGDYKKKDIVDSLNISKYFIQKHDNPPWLTIINFDNFEREVVKSAINEMFDKISNSKITDIGEMLHSFCLSYLLSDRNEINTSFDDLLKSQTDYINKLLDEDLLQPAPLIFNPYEMDIYSRSNTYAYWIEDSYRGYITQVIDHLKRCRNKSKINKYPIYAKEILSTLSTDVEQFKFLLLGNSTESGMYAYVDVMQSIEYSDFVIHWLMLPIEYWSKVTTILNARYKVAAQTDLINEKKWVQQLCIELHLEARRHNGLDRNRIERLIPYSALKFF